MTMVPFTKDKPVLNSARDSATVKNDLNALFNGDWSPLRARAQASPDMTVAVAGSDVEGFWRAVWVNYTQALNYAGGNSPTVTAPSSHPRIDLLTINASGTLAWTVGTEAASPAIPDCPSGAIPICLVYCRTTMTKIYNFEDSGSYPTHGYIYRDVRPWLIFGQDPVLVVAGQTKGDVLYFDGSVWTRLPAGTSGLFLKTLGAGYTPIYDSPIPTSQIGNCEVSLDGESNFQYTTYTVCKAITVPFDGQYRVKFSIKQVDGGTAYGRIYKVNSTYPSGITIGTERSTSSSSYVEYSENFTLGANDQLELRCKISTGTARVYFQNFRVWSNIGAWSVVVDLGSYLSIGNLPAINEGGG